MDADRLAALCALPLDVRGEQPGLLALMIDALLASRDIDAGLAELIGPKGRASLMADERAASVAMRRAHAMLVTVPILATEPTSTFTDAAQVAAFNRFQCPAGQNPGTYAEKIADAFRLIASATLIPAKKGRKSTRDDDARVVVQAVYCYRHHLGMSVDTKFIERGRGADAAKRYDDADLIPHTPLDRLAVAAVRAWGLDNDHSAIRAHLKEVHDASKNEKGKPSFADCMPSQPDYYSPTADCVQKFLRLAFT